MVWNVALKVLKCLVMIVQIKWKTNTKEEELRRRKMGIKGKKNLKKPGLAHFAAHETTWRRHRVTLQGLYLCYEAIILCSSLQLLCWCSRSLPAVAAAAAAVAVMDALIPDARAKSAQLPIHEVTQPAIKDTHGHQDSVLWE